jgi:RND family efflux transporter MFP subunit
MSLIIVGQTAVAEPEAVLVEAKAFSSLSIYPQRRSSAVVVPRNESQLSAQVLARVLDIKIQVGDVVAKGTPLVYLDSKDYQLALEHELAIAEALKAKIELARYEHQRAKTLIVQHAVPEELLKQRETELVVLLAENSAQEVAVQQAQRNIEKCIVRSPYNAVVVQKLAHLGELAASGTPLLRIVDVEQNEVSAKIQSHQVEALKQADSALFIVRANEYPVRLRTVTEAVDTRERTQEVRFTFTKQQALPGSAGELVWTSAAPHLPAEYIARRNGALGVFVIDAGKARFIELVDAEEGRPALVSLADNQQVITKGRYRLQPGDAVRLK